MCASVKERQDRDHSHPVHPVFGYSVYILLKILDIEPKCSFLNVQRVEALHILYIKVSQHRILFLYCFRCIILKKSFFIAEVNHKHFLPKRIKEYGSIDIKRKSSSSACYPRDNYLAV